MGIGLCRTEHMFFAKDRLAHVRSMILAATSSAKRGRARLSSTHAAGGLRRVVPRHAGLPVTVRLIDPPLHEFLPTEIAAREELTQARLQGADPKNIHRLEEPLASSATANRI